MTTFGPDGPMINRRYTVDKDRVNVDVTHEQDEASEDNDPEIALAQAEDEAGERGEDEVRYSTPLEPYRADSQKLEALRKELRANFLDTPGGDARLNERLRETVERAATARLAVLDDVMVDMRRLAEKFDAQAEKMTKAQIQQSVTRIAFAVADVAEAVKRGI